MNVAFIGLGKMGLNMALRLVKSGCTVSGFDVDPEPRTVAENSGIQACATLEELALQKGVRLFWVMVPAGDITRDTIRELAKHVPKRSVIADGGNSHYRDSMALAQELSEKHLAFLDIGTSGGILGIKQGYCLMVGGGKDAFNSCEPLFRILAPDKGYLYCGLHGAGHFAKMIHNGIEYAFMQALGEGFQILKQKKEFSYDLEALAKLWNNGSIIQSLLLGMTEKALSGDADLINTAPFVSDSGEGRWTVKEAVDLGVAAPALSQALFQRFASQDTEGFALRLVAALRHEFGGHGVQKL